MPRRRRGKSLKQSDSNYNPCDRKKNVRGQNQQGRKLQKRRNNRQITRKFNYSALYRQGNNLDYLSNNSDDSNDSTKTGDNFYVFNRKFEDSEPCPYNEIKPELGTKAQKRDLAARFVQIFVQNCYKIPTMELEDRLRYQHSMFCRNKDWIKTFIHVNDFGRYFEICFNEYTDGDGELGLETIRCTLSIEICPTHAHKASSCFSDYGYLHICKYFLLSNCDIMNCKFGHDLYTDHNTIVLQDQLLILLSLDQIQEIVRSLSNRVKGITIPSICTYYNTEKGCSRYQTCPFLHICQHYVKGNCRYQVTCRRSHNIHDKQPMELIEKYGLQHEEEEILFDLINNETRGICPESRKTSSIERKRHCSPPKQNISHSSQDNEQQQTQRSGTSFGNKSGTSSDLVVFRKQISPFPLPNSQYFSCMYPIPNPPLPTYSPSIDDVPFQPKQYPSTHVDEGEKDQKEESQNLIKRLAWRFAVVGENDLKFVPDSERDRTEQKYQEYLKAKEDYLLIDGEIYKIDFSTFSGICMTTKDSTSIALERVTEK